jgi:hypothetical protein
MRARSLSLLIVLATLVAMEPLRAAWAAHHVHHVPAGGFGHRHGHGHDDDACEHHCVLDHMPDLPELEWVPAPRTGVDASARAVLPWAGAVARVDDSDPTRRAKPPPTAAAHPHLTTSIRTVILRL